jgi:hexosaminidase
MNFVKLNVLHIHFTDSDSFPLHLPSCPNMAFFGAYNNDCIYFEKDIHELLTFSAENGVLIIPEIDTPAHTRSWSRAPEYSTINS